MVSSFAGKTISGAGFKFQVQFHETSFRFVKGKQKTAETGD